MKRLRRADSLDDLSERPPLEPSFFQKAIEAEYPLLEMTWKQCLEFEAGSTSSAALHFDSLALLETESSPSSAGCVRLSVPGGVTLHDVEDLHNEIKCCIIKLAEERKQMYGK